MEDYFEFIETCCPKFKRKEDGTLEMFSIPTQHISGDSAKELLDAGVEAFKEVGANISYYEKWKRDLEKELENEPIFDQMHGLTKEDFERIVKYMSNRYFELIGIK